MNANRQIIHGSKLIQQTATSISYQYTRTDLQGFSCCTPRTVRLDGPAVIQDHGVTMGETPSKKLTLGKQMEMRIV